MASLPALGGIGLLFAAFIDSSFVPLPLVTDLILFDLSSLHPMRMPFYAAMAALGSVAGCLWIYYLARKGGQVYYRKTEGHPPGRIRKLVERHPMACVFLPAVAPFPVPFKPFVVAQGVFQVPLATFIVGTLLGRGCLFLFEGFLGARYGTRARPEFPIAWQADRCRSETEPFWRPRSFGPAGKREGASGDLQDFLRSGNSAKNRIASEAEKR